MKKYLMKKLLLLALIVAGLSAHALPTYEPFTEYSSLVTAGGGSVDLATNGFYVTNGPVVEQWGGGSSGFGLFFKTTGLDVLVTNYPASVFTSANLATILPTGFPGAGSDIYLNVYLNPNAGANSAGNSAVFKFAQDIPRPTSGVKTIYVSYLINCQSKGAAVGSGNVGRYAGFLSQSNIFEGTGSGGAYTTWASMFNTFSATGPNYVSYGQKITSPNITNIVTHIGGNDILASDSAAANSPGSGNAGVGVIYNTANFVVGCFSFTTGGSIHDTNTVWVNPPLTDFGGPTPSINNLNSFTMTNVMSDVDAFFLESRSGSALGGISPTFIGNLLIGTTWSYVTGGPEFTNQPASVMIPNDGATVSFTGGAVAAAQSMSYQWQHIVGSTTNNLTDGVGTAGGSATVSGSASNTLTLTGVSAGDRAGIYQLAGTASGTGFTLASQPVSIILSVNTNQAPVVANIVTNSVTAGLQWKIAITNLAALAAWSDPDAGDTVTLASVAAASANGTNVTSDANYIYYNGAVTAEDHFTYTVTDGTLTTSGAVYLEAASQTAPSISSPTVNGSGNPTFSGHGIPNYVYGVESSTNLVDAWIEAGTATADPTGAWSFTDLTQTNPPTIFYRLYYPDNPGSPPQ